MNEHLYLCLPDGTVCWDPGPDDFATAREEERDLDGEWD
jgi:hypothetical protein